MITGNINTVPAEIFMQILGHIPVIGNAKSVLGVNREWYATYKGMLQGQKLEWFNALLETVYYSADYNLHTNSLRFIRFCKSFDMMKRLHEKSIELIHEKHEAGHEEQVIQNLFDHYENSPTFNGWWPDWLWERRKKRRGNFHWAQIKIRKFDKVLLSLHKF